MKIITTTILVIFFIKCAAPQQRSSRGGRSSNKATSFGSIKNDPSESSSTCSYGEYSINTFCRVCEKGHKCLEAIKTPCEIGTYQDEKGQETCKRCPENRFTANTGSIECELCPEGQTTKDSVIASECSCANGYYSDEPSG